MRGILRAGLAGCVLVSTAWAQSPGTLIGQAKISAVAPVGFPRPALDPLDQFGRAVVVVGDLNGDGIEDLAVGAHGDDDGGVNGDNIGAVWIVFLDADDHPLGYQKISALEGNFGGLLEREDGFGRALAALGDVDGNGIPDLAVGSIRDDDGGVDVGAVYILLLESGGTVGSWFKLGANTPGFTGVLSPRDEFGRSIVSLGDLDGDGVDDWAVGAPNDDQGGADEGAFYILFLNADWTVKSFQKIWEGASGWLGPVQDHAALSMSLATLGDIDGDGVVDLAVGSIGDNTGGFQSGAVWIVRLNTDGTVKGNRKIHRLTPGFDGAVSRADEFGFGVAGLGDVNGDGVPDVAAGAILDDDGGNQTTSNLGAVHVIFLEPDGRVVGSQKISMTQGGFLGHIDPSDWFGSAVASFGDRNGDGVGDLLVGARFDDDGGANKGAIYLFRLAGATVEPEPPLADFAADVTSGDVPLSVTFADASTGTITSWAWDFGDGGSSTQASPQYTYTVAGTYDVALTVTGPAGSDMLLRPAYILANDPPPPPPVAGFGSDVQTGEAPLAVQFTDFSTGLVTSWSWSFGDGGSSTVQHPAHTYTLGGTYDVSLVVTGPGGSDTLTEPGWIVVDEPVAPPVAGFGSDVQTGDVPLTVQFADASTGVVSAWSWDFGDGGTSSLENPSYTYTVAGTFDVTLLVTGEGGSDSLTQFGFIVANDPPPPAPVAGFGSDVQSGEIPLDVAFFDSSTGSITAWAWDFGDGGMSTATDPTHTYTVAGTYDVTLTVTGPGGSDTLVQPGFITADEPAGTAGITPYGCGVNPDGSLVSIAGVPRPGVTIQVGLDNPLGTQGPGTATVFQLSFLPDPAFPCGTLLPNQGMTGPGAFGESLLDRSEQFMRLGGDPWTTPGVPVIFSIDIPANPALIGQKVYGQGILIDTAATFGVRRALTNGLVFEIQP